MFGGGDGFTFNFTLPFQQVPAPTTTTPAPAATPPANEKAPTSPPLLTITPNPANMYGNVLGQVVTNGYNWPATAYIKHRGDGSQTSFDFLIGPDGKFDLIQQVNTPGRLEVWVQTIDGIRSNMVILTVRGIKIIPDSDRYSQLLDDECIFEVYSHFDGNCQVYSAQFGDWALERYLTNVVINSDGYGTFGISLDALPRGNTQFDARIAGNTAVGWEGDCWVGIGR